MAIQKFQNSTSFRIKKLNLYLMLVVSVLILGLASCVKKKDKPIRFFAVKYEKAEIKKWIDPPGKLTAGFIFQFYSTNGEKYDTAFGSIAYPLDSNRAYLMPPDTLLVDRSRAAITFDGKIILGNNWISRATINTVFIKPDGTERDFDYVLLIPKLDKFNYRHVVYDIKVFKGNTEIPDIFQAGDESKPSPPAPPRN